MKTKLLKRVISCLTATALTATMLSYPAVAEEVTTETESYPYTLFAASTNEGAITVNASNFCVNGNIATNGTIVSSGNMNVNGTKIENADEEMIYIFDKIDSQYFSDSTATTYDEDYTYSETNITIDIPIEVEGETTLTGNIKINTALKSLENINLYGEVKNTNDAVIFSKYGDVIIESTNVNLNGLVYAPFGDVTVTAQNLNLNNVVIIADTITFNCPNVNANFSDTAASFVGTTSEDFYAPYDEWVYLDDTDSDGLPDLIEKELGSDPENSDTDGDGLPDGYEALTLATDPTSTDTDENGVSDADEDFDEDGLTNLQEYQQNTEPYNDDTDGDGLLDGEEINTYFTDPHKVDTDEDGLEDGDEIYFECDPNNTDTDGNGILDGDEKRFQTYVHEVENEDCAVTEVRVSAEATGNMQKTTTVESIMDKDVLCTDVVGLVGEPFEVETTSEFDTATLTFVVDQSKLGDTEFDNLLFLWYNEDEDEFVELETVLDAENSTVSVETTHFSKYMIVDKKDWFEAWSTNLYEEVDSHDTTGFDTILVIDCSGSMSSNDPDAEGRKEAAEKFIKLIRTKDRIAILAEDSTPKVLCDFTSLENKNVLLDALDDIYSTGGNNFNASIKKSVDMFKSESTTTHKNIIFMSDGGCDISDNTLQSAKDLNITIYTVGFGKYSQDDILEHMAEYTGGEFYKAKTADELVDIYEKIGTEQYLDLTDTDGDGLADIFEQSGMRTTDGNLIRSDYDNKDTDGDGLEDGEEINSVYKLKEIPYSVTGDTEIVGIEFVMYSNPRLGDSDGDGLLDGKDANPLTIFDGRFFVSDDFNSIIPESAFVNNRWLQSESCYHSVDPDCEDWIASEALLSALALGDAFAYLPIPSSMIWSGMQAGKFTWGNLDNAADMLYYYITNSYSEVVLSEKDIKDIVSCHDNNMLHLEYNIDQLMNVSEQTTYNTSNVICTTPNSNFRAVCMVDRECACELRGEKVNGTIHPNAICRLDTAKQSDWNLAIGSSYGGMTAEVVSDGNIYTMKYRYYVLDIYEWAAHVSDPDDLSLMLHRLHEIGLAHQYLITGYFEGELTWQKGERTSAKNVMTQIEETLES